MLAQDLEGSKENGMLQSRLPVKNLSPIPMLVKKRLSRKKTDVLICSAYLYIYIYIYLFN
jgi:hypothetical protein